ncbi:MAG TPA: anthranilate phosphoribosyltransferase, partial [Thermotoga naphthophila]|nr:anthranilate phosphoribosyltransferase [Thermotoga petrophila]
PARVKYQVVGVFDLSFASKLATALQRLGTERSAVVNGGFTDELTTCGK